MRRSQIIVALGLVVASLVFLWWQQPRGLTVTFLDVGQGDSTLVRTPAGQVVLIDGGPDTTVVNKLGQYLPWNERTIDLVVLSHPHADHVTGLIYVLKRYHVRHLVITGAIHTTREYLEFLKLIRDQRIPVTIAHRGQTFTLDGGVSVEVLWPNQSYEGVRVSDLNATSIVNTVRYGTTRALFTGDTPKENEAAMLAASVDLKAQLLKVPHQGSDTSSSEAFLKAVAPEVAVISVGAHNQYGHPHPAVFARLKQLIPTVLRTDQAGDITFVSDGHVWHRR